MATTLVQEDRWITLETPLGQDVFVATEARGTEGISRLFTFTVSALSTRKSIDPKDLLGKSVTLSLARPGGSRRYVNGIVTSFSAGAFTRNDYRLYTLVISPSLWLLQRTSDHKVFQEKTAVAIAEQLLGDSEVAFEKKLNGTYETSEYRVQFGETDFDFLQRILAEEGIFYFFKHQDGDHKLVLADNASAYADCAQDDVQYRQAQEEAVDSVHSFDTGASLTDASWHIEDYDFEKPSTNIEGERKTNQQPASGKSWEHFRFPGKSLKADNLKQFATAAIDAAEAGFETATGGGTCASFTGGHAFTLKEHPVDAENRRLVLTEVQHEAIDRAHFTTRPGTDGRPYYRNTFTCMPATRIARNPLPAPKPVVQGPQTALVVGPSGEEIHTDKYGRIRIQFYWDRYGKKNETSSCFVRVAQSLAGSNWGSVFVPRIGMEVVVQFLDGDPDRPLVTGAVYNADNMPPWALPTNMTKSGLLTRSSKSGQTANANELSFEDKKGEEKITFHAEKDFLREVENDDTLTVDHDQKRTIKNDRTTEITEGNETFTIKKGNRTEKIETGNETLDIDKGNRTVTLSTGGDTLTLKQGDRAVTLTAGSDSLTLNQGNQTTKASAGKITLEAMQGITLKCGSSTVEITQTGITIKGVTVSIEGAAKSEIKGPIVNVAGDGMAIVKGGMVKIN
ncbi:MAG TPA: type VI secretion system tip protein TssI/VgrG [Shinella sp.]|jgi:type VI secretion system secreted protein VgrG|uniref:type VI secretion system Vgr family protein n=1 Tax=Shinella sp. TaxID=1870904 RepID=UPI002E0E42A3|nr:type VI secretion system tip protein TssI/VgrG [Shinella sp.]